VPRWVTVIGRVNHSERNHAPRPTQPEPALCAGWYEYLAKAGGVNRHITWHTSPRTWSCSVSLMPGWWLTGGDQRRLMGSGSTLETCSWRRTIQMAAFTLFYFTYLLITVSQYTLVMIATYCFCFSVLLLSNDLTQLCCTMTFCSMTSQNSIRSSFSTDFCTASDFIPR